MRIGFVTGSIAQIGSGRTEAVPLARAIAQLGCDVYGLETTRFKRGQIQVDKLDVHFEPVAPYLAPRSLRNVRSLVQRRANRTLPTALKPYDVAMGSALLALGARLELDAVYAFHNTNVARLLNDWPHPSRLLIINLIGFGIDPSRGGAADTFPLQRLIFERPYWDLHITATRFEFEQYCDVYEQLGIDQCKLMQLPHSYDEGLFRPMTSIDPRPGCAQDRKIILYPVNVYRRKNIELAIDVISVLSQDIDCKLVVTGSIWDQDYHSRLLQYARVSGAGDRIEFLGGVTLDRLIQLYCQADVTIYTSHQETFGHGIVESLGCGTPVVGPEWIVPCREILDVSLGGWTAPKDAQGFAGTIRESLLANLDPEQLAAHARARYGNMAVATQFLERCREIKARKNTYQATLTSIDWKGLYGDAGDLL